MPKTMYGVNRGRGGGTVLPGRGSGGSGGGVVLPSRNLPGGSGRGPQPPGSSSGSGSGSGSSATTNVAPVAQLNLTAQPSPEMASALAEWKRRQAEMEAKAKGGDEGLAFQVEQYKKRLGTDTTQHAIDRAASTIRDQAAGMSAAAEGQGGQMGRGPGYQAGGIAEAAQRALAGQSADISLARERDLDALTLGGQNLMAAPGQRAMSYEQMQNQFYSQNPYMQTAQLGLQQQGLGLEAYRAQLQAQQQQAQLAAQQYGTPYQMLQLLYGG